MRTEALNRVRLIFTLFDVNGNGVLEADDFDLMSDHVVRAVPGADSAAKEAMARAFRRYWTTLVAELDADGDGRVDFEEYTACVLAPERFDGAIGEFAEALSVLGDLDGHGTVSRPVFGALMKAIGFVPANSDALFDALGPDGRDHITAAAWDAAIREYYRPDVADTPGDHLLASPAA